jgi:hypothetical protein
LPLAALDEPGRMSGNESASHVRGNSRHSVGSQRASRQAGAQRFTVEQFSHEIRAPVSEAHTVQADDIRVIQRRGPLCLPHDAPGVAFDRG